MPFRPKKQPKHKFTHEVLGMYVYMYIFRYIYICILNIHRKNVCALNSNVLRMVKNTADFALNIYWTRLQVGVRSKQSKRQVWTTSQSMDIPGFGEKIRLANAVAARLQYHVILLRSRNCV